jgi:hypothetical protein
MIHRACRVAVLVALLAGGAVASADAQATAPPIDFSGVMFGNWQSRSDSVARAQTGGKSFNQFAIDRVYLTFRMPAGDRASIRATTDIFQNAASGYYGGWSARLKYGYLQYDALRDVGGQKGFNLTGRLGMLHTVVIDQEEQFWPRYLSPTGVDRFGFFSSADLGIAAQVTLPGKWGEAYGHLTNGPGYTAPESDRFKDAGIRLTLTPLAKYHGLFQTLAISPWLYKGYAGSRFVAGGPGQVGPVADALKRDRWGIFVGSRDPRLTFGVHYARRTDGYEYGSNTPAAPRTTSDTAGVLLSTYALVRPLSWGWGKNVSRLGVVLRRDEFRSHGALPGKQQLLIAGIEYAPTARTALALDFQDLSTAGYAGRAPVNETRTVYVHWSAAF